MSEEQISSQELIQVLKDFADKFNAFESRLDSLEENKNKSRSPSPIQSPKSSEDSKKNTESPSSGIQPVVPQLLAGMTNEELMQNFSFFLQNPSQIAARAPTNRRATIEGSIRKNQEEANSNEDRVLRIVQIDDSDLLGTSYYRSSVG